MMYSCTHQHAHGLVHELLGHIEYLVRQRCRHQHHLQTDGGVMGRSKKYRLAMRMGGSKRRSLRDEEGRPPAAMHAAGQGKHDGCRTHLCLRGKVSVDVVDLLLEPSIQHLISLVQYKHFEAASNQVPALQSR